MVASWVAAPMFASRELRLSWGNSQLGLSSDCPRAKRLVSQITGSVAVSVWVTGNSVFDVRGEGGWVGGRFPGGSWPMSCSGHLGLLRQKSFWVSPHFHS